MVMMLSLRHDWSCSLFMSPEHVCPRFTSTRREVLKNLVSTADRVELNMAAASVSGEVKLLLNLLRALADLAIGETGSYR